MIITFGSWLLECMASSFLSPDTSITAGGKKRRRKKEEEN
jgi:hypothetical protein